MRVIIVIKNPVQHGKSETLKETIRAFQFHAEEILPDHYGERGLDANGAFTGRDTRVLAQYRGVRLGFENMNDADSSVGRRLKHLIDEECDIILITCAQRSDVWDNLVDVAEQYDFKLITFSNLYQYASPYSYAKTSQRDDDLIHFLHETSASALRRLIDHLVTEL